MKEEKLITDLIYDGSLNVCLKGKDCFYSAIKMMKLYPFSKIWENSEDSQYYGVNRFAYELYPLLQDEKFKAILDNIIENANISEEDTILEISKKLVDTAKLDDLLTLRDSAIKYNMFFHNVRDTLWNLEAMSKKRVILYFKIL